MAARVASGEAVLPDEDAVNAMQRAAIDGWPGGLRSVRDFQLRPTGV